MRCCVHNCFKDFSKKTNQTHGITFHKLPKDPEHSAAWLAALAGVGFHMNKHLVVCSEHFLSEDFEYIGPNRRRVKRGAIPTKLVPVIQEELKVCRVCLALDVKMHNIKDFGLSEMFQNVTGISAIDVKASRLQRVCWECTARLTAAAAFREKALLSDALLKDQVLIKESDIALLKQNYSSLKSTLSVIPAFTSADIECEPIISKNNEKDNIFIANDGTAIKERETKVSVKEKEVEFEDYEHLIDIPVKTEVESDPMADNTMRYQDRISDAFLELTHFNDTSSREDSGDEMANSELKFNNNDNILSEDTQNKVPSINDSNVVIVEDNYNVEIKPKLEEIGNIVRESSREEDPQNSSEAVSISKSEQKIRRKVGTIKGKATIKNSECLNRKIIAMKENGVPVPVIAKENGVSKTCSVTEIESASEQNNCANEAGKEMTACSTTVRQRLQQAGLEHILMKKPERTVNIGKKLSIRQALHEELKRRIIALKQEGMSIRQIAYLLETSRNTVRRWWYRWDKEGHMNNRKPPGGKKKTTTLEDRLVIEQVAQGQPVHTATLAKELGVSTKVLRRRLKQAGLKVKVKKASVPLRSGRSHKVDEITKEQIISMKNNGISVTDIANQFRVTRNSVYLWWRRWCKENNIKIIRENNTSSTVEQEQSVAEDTNDEMIVQRPSILSSHKSIWQKMPDL